MIYELRTYTLKPGTLAEYLRLNSEVGHPIRGDRYGRLVGSLTTEVGTINQYVHLWRYDSFDERDRLRAELAKRPEWIAYLPKTGPLIAAQESMILKLDERIGFRPVVGTGHVYEMRSYRTQTGKAGAWANALADVLPARERYSKIVGLWTSEVAQLNTAMHLWVYDDLNQRAEARAAALQDPEWQAFLPLGSSMLVDLQSVILVPTDLSPLR